LGDTVKKNTAIGIMIESSEGVYEAPDSAAKFVQTLADGTELNPSKELLERNISNASIGKTSPRIGQSQVAGSLPVEFRAFSTEGTAPEYDGLIKAALGNKRTIATTTTTKASGNTATVLQIEDADISKFNVGDIVMTKASGAYHVSPIASKTSGAGTASITLLVAHPSGDHPDSVVVSKSTTYIVADSGHPTLSISKYVEDAVREYATGCRVASMAIEGFSTGQLPSLNFGFEGLDYAREVSAIPFTPSYDSALPPIILSAGMYMNGTSLEVNELTVELENTIAYRTAIQEANGRSGSRITERSISGSIDPYKPDDSVANYTKYAANTAFSLFAYAMVPTATPGQFGNVVAVYMPNCIITELTEADQDGLLKDSITFSANRGADGTTPEIYIAVI
jgi:hypothetical protein